MDLKNLTVNSIVELCKMCINNKNLWRFDFFVSNTGICFFVFEVNIEELTKRVFQGEEIPREDLVFLYLRYEEESDHLGNYFNMTAPKIPTRSSIPQTQPLGFRKNLKLYKYQLDCVSWMKSLEQDVESGYWYIDLIGWKGRKSKIMFNLSMKNPSIVVPTDFNLYKKLSKPKGGVLAEEMGLGKTMEIIALILANPGDPSILEGYSEESNDEKPIKPIKTDPASLNDLFITNATLVLCPSHLIKQWHQEIEKCTRPVLNVIVITNMAELKRITYRDIVSTDIVLVPFSMLKNANYFRLGSKIIGPPTFGEEELRYNWVNQQLRSVRLSNTMDHNSPLLDHFHWHRIVVDEAHEIMGNPFYTTSICNLQKNFAWFVSGTPFTNIDTSNGITRFLGFPETIYYPTWVFSDIILNNLIWRNTKESIKQEYQIPPVLEDLKLLDFTPIEQALYSCVRANTKRQRMICCNAAIDDKFGNIIGGFCPLSKILAPLKTFVNTRQADLRKEKQYATQQLKTLQEEILSPPKALSSSEDIRKWTLKKEKEIRDKTSSIESKKLRIKEFKHMHVALSTIEDIGYTGPKNVARLAELPFEIPSIIESQELSKIAPTSEKVKTNEDENEDEDDDLKGSQIVSMTVAQLTSELERRKIAIPKQSKKGGLIALLSEAVKNSIKIKAEVDTKENAKGKQASKKRKSKSNHKPEPKKQKVDAEVPVVKKTASDKIREYNILRYLTEQHGTKLASLITYLKNLWFDSPSSKVLLFSQFPQFLARISELLSDYGVDNAVLEGNTVKRGKAIDAFKSKDDQLRIMLLNSNSAAAGINLIEATHIVFAEPPAGKRQEALSTEAQAIGRAHRQGQTSHVTIVRFIIRSTIEYDSYIQNNAPEQNVQLDEAAEEAVKILGRGSSFSGRPSLQKTTSYEEDINVTD